MLKVSANEVQDRFSELLDRVKRGEKIAIVRWGKMIACLEPPKTDARIRGRRDRRPRNVLAQKKSKLSKLAPHRSIVGDPEKLVSLKVSKRRG